MVALPYGVKIFWSIAIGAALGGVARYYLGTAIQVRADTDFPVGTLVINVLGSFIVGVVLRLALSPDMMSETTRLFLTTGFCGGFTTFSAFSAEAVALMQQQRFGRAAAYVGLSVALALGATAAGFVIADRLAAARSATQPPSAGAI